jgi:hypothetical protein
MTTIRRKAAPRLIAVCYWCKKIVGYRPCIPIMDGKETAAACRTCTPLKMPTLEITEDMTREWDRLDATLAEEAKERGA